MDVKSRQDRLAAMVTLAVDATVSQEQIGTWAQLGALDHKLRLLTSKYEAALKILERIADPKYAHELTTDETLRKIVYDARLALRYK